VQGGDPSLLIRLDSGWGLRAAAPYNPLRWERKPPPFVATVMQALNCQNLHTQVYKLIKGVSERLRDENTLYRLLILHDESVKQGLPLGFFSKFKQNQPGQGTVVKEDWAVTRRIWHLFLRWIDDLFGRDNILMLNRGGVVTLIDTSKQENYGY
jgi:hypothetical protein